MKPKEFANEFGVSVNEMCKITELTRQGLNNIDRFVILPMEF